MMGRTNKSKAADFRQKDSRRVDTPTWPRVIFDKGSWITYVRLKRHSFWWLVHVVAHTGVSPLYVFESLQRLHEESFRHYNCFIIDLNQPMLEGTIGNVPWAYFDIDQTDGVDRIKKEVGRG